MSGNHDNGLIRQCGADNAVHLGLGPVGKTSILVPSPAVVVAPSAVAGAASGVVVVSIETLLNSGNNLGAVGQRDGNHSP